MRMEFHATICEGISRKTKKRQLIEMRSDGYVVRMICGPNIGFESDIWTAFLMQKCPCKIADTLIFRAIYATLLHRYTSRCVVRYYDYG